MKKQYPTAIDETATLFDRIYLSGGQRGLMLGVDPVKTAEFIGAEFKDLTV
jgi:Cys-tRNA(Pro)/Cys-tRNA(Cys) deacylase